MRLECKRATYCKRCFLEGCPFGRNGEPSEDEYPTATDRCKHYEQKEAYKTVGVQQMNGKNYPMHPGQTHMEPQFMQIPVEEYESLKKRIEELQDKVQQKDFFWEGCGLSKRGFKNTIAVSEAFDKLEAENAELKAMLERLGVEQKDQLSLF